MPIQLSAGPDPPAATKPSFGAGNDTVDGGTVAGTVTPDSRNVINYFGSPAATEVWICGLVQPLMVMGSDTLVHINWVVGSRFDDVLSGSDLALDERFEGAAGADLIDGRGGSDTVSYQSAAERGVTVNLVDGVATDWSGATDRLTAIEHAIGTGFVDTLTGDALANTLWGLAGNDVLVGLAGDDTFNGGDGNDQLNGGVGSDTANFTLRREDYLVKERRGFHGYREVGRRRRRCSGTDRAVGFSGLTLSLVPPPCRARRSTPTPASCSISSSTSLPTRPKPAN